MADNDGLGRLPADAFDLGGKKPAYDESPRPSAEDKRAMAFAQLSELLEWERKQRAEAQAKVAELDAELHRVRLDAVAEQKRLRLELAAAEADASSGSQFEREFQDATQRFKAEIEDQRVRIAELEEALAKAASQGQSAERTALEDARRRARATRAAQRTGRDLGSLREQWTACQLELTEQRIAARDIFEDAQKRFAAAAAGVVEREGSEKRRLAEAAQAVAAEKTSLEEALAAARAEVRRLSEQLGTAQPAAEAAATALKKSRADGKRLQELCDKLRGDRDEVSQLKRARDEALAAAATAEAAEKKLRGELDMERGRTSTQAAKAQDAAAAAAAAQARAEALQREIEALLAAAEVAKREAMRRGPQVRPSSLRPLRGSSGPWPHPDPDPDPNPDPRPPTPHPRPRPRPPTPTAGECVLASGARGCGPRAVRVRGACPRPVPQGPRQGRDDGD